MIDYSRSLKQQVRIFLSLGGLFFFGPYVQYYLKRTSIKISPEDKRFILSYAKLGYVSIALGVTIAVLGGYDFIYPTYVVELIYTICIYLLVALLTVGSVFVFSHTQMVSASDEPFMKVTKVKTSQKNVLKSFLPGYNYYLWYKVHQFSHPFWALKESLLWTALFVLTVLVTHSTIWAGGVILIAVVRLITLMSGFDVVPNSWKDRSNKLFLVNVEELWGDLKGLLLFIWYKNVRGLHVGLDATVQAGRTEYMKLYSFKGNFGLAIEYLLLFVAILYSLIGLTESYLFGFRLGIEIVSLALLIIRYLIMIPYRQFPLIPIFHEFAQAVVWVLRKIGLHV